MDVAELMAVFDEPANAEGDERDAVVARVQALATEGRLVAVDG